MGDPGDWKNLLERGRRLAEVKISSLLEDPEFPGSHWTDWDMVEETGESNNLAEAAEEIDKPPEPDRRYRLGTVLATGFGSDESIRNYEPVRLDGAIMVIGGALGTLINLSGAPPGLQSLAADRVGEGIKKDEESHMQKTYIEERDASAITESLSSLDKYALRPFREEVERCRGEAEYVDSDELYDFLEDMESDKIDVEWKVKRKEDHPLQVIGVTVTGEETANPTYDRRERIAEETAEEYDGISKQDVLDVGRSSSYREVPTAWSNPQGEQSYSFAIVDVNPDNQGFVDYSRAVGEGTSERELETEEET